MLANKGLYEEIKITEAIIEQFEKEKKVFEARMLKSQVLILKLLHSLRTNSVTLMKHHGIEIESKPPSNEPKKTKPEVKK